MTETMRIQLKVFICLMTAGVSLLSWMGTKGGPVNFICKNTSVNLTAHHGDSVTITCKYPRTKKSSIKSFYNEDGINLISSYLSNYTKRGRFSLTDDKQEGVYTVIISSLTEDDAGKYLCTLQSVEDNSTECLIESQLHILNSDDISQMEPINHAPSETAQITCKYPKSHEGNEKFLCKGENPLNCEELIQTTQQNRDVVKGRFDIRDNQRKNYFYVYINYLTEADSGTYWCGSGRTMQHDEYSKIHLSVAVKGTKLKKSVPPGLHGTTTEPELTTIEGKNPTNPANKYASGVIAGVGVCLALLAVAGVVLILYRCKLLRAKGGSSERKTSAVHNSEENNEDHNYEEVSLQHQVESSPATVYATVGLPADLLHYSCVTFHMDGNSPSDTDINGTAQGAAHPPETEQTLYSAIKNCNEGQ